MEDREIGEQYYKDQDRYKAYAQSLAELLAHLAETSNVELSGIEWRVKDFQSFLRKVHENGCEEAPFDGVRDIVGLRAITFYNDAAREFADVVKSHLAWAPEHSQDKLEELAETEFGYRSVHVTVKLDPIREELPEYQAYAGLWAELQIRSVLQHAWAAISHKLDYRSATQAPTPLRRNLFRLSALLELADEEFARFRDAAQEMRQEYQHGLAKGEVGMGLDLDSLRSFVAQRVDLAAWEELGRCYGIRMAGLDEADRQGFEQLLLVAQGLGIATIGALQSELAAAYRTDVKPLDGWAGIHYYAFGAPYAMAIALAVAHSEVTQTEAWSQLAQENHLIRAVKLNAGPLRKRTGRR